MLTEIQKQQVREQIGALRAAAANQPRHVKTVAEARRLPEGGSFQNLEIVADGKKLLIPYSIGVLVLTEPDDILFFTDSDGRKMQIVHTILGPHKSEV